MMTHRLYNVSQILAFNDIWTNVLIIYLDSKVSFILPVELEKRETFRFLLSEIFYEFG